MESVYLLFNYGNKASWLLQLIEEFTGTYSFQGWVHDRDGQVHDRDGREYGGRQAGMALEQRWELTSGDNNHEAKREATGSGVDFWNLRAHPLVMHFLWKCHIS